MIDQSINLFINIYILIDIKNYLVILYHIVNLDTPTISFLFRFKKNSSFYHEIILSFLINNNYPLFNFTPYK